MVIIPNQLTTCPTQLFDNNSYQLFLKIVTLLLWLLLNLIFGCLAEIGWIVDYQNLIVQLHLAISLENGLGLDLTSLVFDSPLDNVEINFWYKLGNIIFKLGKVLCFAFYSVNTYLNGISLRNLSPSFLNKKKISLTEPDSCTSILLINNHLIWMVFSPFH